MAKTREFLLVWDSTMANPNGDMLNENRPRQDEETSRFEVSDVRIKRFIREDLINSGIPVLVQADMDEKGKVASCATRIKNICKKNKLKEDDTIGVRDFLLKEFIDVRLFGAVITKPKFDLMGPLQIVWSQSIHEGTVKFLQGNAAYASGENKSQASIWSKYITPYALFKTYAVYNDLAAQRQGIIVSEEDIECFKTHLIDGLKHYRSTSKNQMPRLLVEVVYNTHYVDGELNYIDFNKHVEDTLLREISEVECDLTKLGAYYEAKKDVIDHITIYKHPSVKVVGLRDDYEVISI